MSDVIYTSRVHIDAQAGPLRIAKLPGEPQPVVFSVHGAIAEHYKVNPASITEPHASTLDYVIAATAVVGDEFPIGSARVVVTYPLRRVPRRQERVRDVPDHVVVDPSPIDCRLPGALLNIPNDKAAQSLALAYIAEIPLSA